MTCPSCSSLQPCGPLDPRLTRLFELAQWLRTIDVCAACALELALVQVGRETGEPVILCAGSPLVTECRDKARAKWTEMPQNTENVPRKVEPRETKRYGKPPQKVETTAK